MQGSKSAQVNLGTMYFKGEGVTRDIVLAFAWTDLVAAQGDSLAIENLNKYRGHMTSSQVEQAKEMSEVLRDRINPQ